MKFTNIFECPECGWSSDNEMLANRHENATGHEVVEVIEDE